MNIRHTLTPFLKEIGGHVGYWIRPSQRGKGYGKEILHLSLPFAKNLGLTKVLVTCDISNSASAKIIEANGGILEDITPLTPNHAATKRYWIPL